jgi:hypothetical protein
MKPQCDQGIPNLPDSLANPANGEKVINERHGDRLRQ